MPSRPPSPALRSRPVTIYRPNIRHRLGLLRTWAVMAGNVWSARELIWQLFRRDFFAAYRKSFLGLTWAFLTPALGILSWVFLQQAGLLRPGHMAVPYPVYVLVGTSMWALFMGLFEAASATLESGQELIMQVNYPHEALLFKQAAQQIANFSIGFALNIVVMLLFGVVPHWASVFLPLVALPLFLLASAVGLVVSMISVVAIDLTRAIRLGMTLLMYGAPIVYAPDVASDVVRTVIRWNPLTYLVCSCRDLVLCGRLFDPARYLVCASISVLLFLLSWRLFFVSEDKVVERMV